MEIDQNILIPHADERFKTLINLLHLCTKDKTQQKTLHGIFRNYQSVFYFKNESLSINKLYKQDIKINDNTPVYIRSYRLPHTDMNTINT